MWKIVIIFDFDVLGVRCSNFACFFFQALLCTVVVYKYRHVIYAIYAEFIGENEYLTFESVRPSVRTPDTEIRTLGGVK